MFWILSAGPYLDMSVAGTDAGRYSAVNARRDHDVLVSFDPFHRDAAARPTPLPMIAVPTDLEMKLFGTRLGAGETGSSAIIRLPDYNHTVLERGDEISPGVILSEIHERHVVLTRDGRNEILRLDSEDGRAATGELQDMSAPPTDPDAGELVRALNGAGLGEFGQATEFHRALQAVGLIADGTGEANSIGLESQ